MLVRIIKDFCSTRRTRQDASSTAKRKKKISKKKKSSSQIDSDGGDSSEGALRGYINSIDGCFTGGGIKFS